MKYSVILVKVCNFLFETMMRNILLFLFYFEVFILLFFLEEEIRKCENLRKCGFICFCIIWNVVVMGK